MLLSDDYREQNRLLHETKDDYGISGHKWATQILKAIEDDGGYASILDYGCGKSTLAAALAKKDIAIAEYDPAIPGKDTPPEPAELVICGDVLEHVEPDCLDAVLADLKRLAQRKLIVVIDMLPSDKTLADGRNTHLITEDPKWWGAKLSKTFDVLEWYPVGRKLYAELAPKLPGWVPTKRRVPPPQWDEQIAAAKAEFNRYSDVFSRIETVSRAPQYRQWASVFATRLSHLGHCTSPLLTADFGRFGRAIFWRGRRKGPRSARQGD